MSDERHIELTWRCSSCQHKNLGRHMVCEGCGNPKDDSEEYEMPADPSAVASVDDDPELLRKAKAGANWKCAYCDSDQRDLDGGCARCGAGRKAVAATAEPLSRLAPERDPGVTRKKRFGVVHGVLAAIVGVTLLVGACLVMKKKTPDAPLPLVPSIVAVQAPPPVRTEFDGAVKSASWTRRIAVQKWQLAAHEDFTTAVPEGAVEVRAAGQHVHHNEDVFDHDETVYDDVEVPDGYKTESYTERKSCGEDCTTTPRTCKKVCTRSTRTCRQDCTNKKNGFASCRDVCTGGDETCRDDCSGGDRKCTTKYCNETRTRQIPKTRIEKRPRVVKKYRSEPRYAAWSTFKTFEWVTLRTVEDAHDDAEPIWPDAGIALSPTHDAGTGTAADGGGVRPGAEQLVKHESFHVQITTDDGAEVPYVPATEEELRRLSPGSHVKLRVVGGSVTLL